LRSPRPAQSRSADCSRAILVDGLALGVGGVLILARRPEARWLGCTTLPVACIAGTDPAGVAEQSGRSKHLVTAAPVRVIPHNTSRPVPGS